MRHVMLMIFIKACRGIKYWISAPSITIMFRKNIMGYRSIKIHEPYDLQSKNYSNSYLFDLFDVHSMIIWICRFDYNGLLARLWCLKFFNHDEGNPSQFHKGQVILNGSTVTPVLLSTPVSTLSRSLHYRSSVNNRLFSKHRYWLY